MERMTVRLVQDADGDWDAEFPDDDEFERLAGVTRGPYKTARETEHALRVVARLIQHAKFVEVPYDPATTAD